MYIARADIELALGHVDVLVLKLTELKNGSSILGELSLSSRALAAHPCAQLLLLCLLLLLRSTSTR